MTTDLAETILRKIVNDDYVDLTRPHAIIDVGIVFTDDELAYLRSLQEWSDDDD